MSEDLHRIAEPGEATRTRRRSGLRGALLAVLLLAVPGPLREAIASVVPYLDLEEMERQGEVIVLGTIESTEAAMSDDGRLIVTRVSVKVEKSLKGGPRAALVLEVPGGTLRGQTLVASGAPVFRTGERVVLFLGRNGGPDTSPIGVVGWNQGRFDVQRDPRTGRDLVRQPGGGSLYIGPEGRPAARDPRVTGPRVLNEFLKEVEALVSRSRDRERGPGAGGRP